MADIDIAPTPSTEQPVAPATVIVFGNEKGGSGKSTGAMHVSAGLLRLGFSVGCIDLDNRQWTLSRYVENRRATAERDGANLPLPELAQIARSGEGTRVVGEADERKRFQTAIAQFSRDCDFIVIDCPGTDTFLGRLAISLADKLITPMNDSFVDLDVLAEVDGLNGKISRLSVYAETIWEQRKQRAAQGAKPIDWIVMRNRLSQIHARNKQDMERVLSELSGRLGFRIAPGFAERVIFRELFPRGLTMIDVLEAGDAGDRSMSHLAARQEVRSLLNALQLPHRVPKRSQN